MTQRDERLAAVEAKFRAESGALKKKDEATRDRIVRDSDPQQQQLKEKYNQAVWLADSVFDSTQGQLREDLKKKRDEIRGEQATLSEMETKAGALMHLYGVPAPAVEAPVGALADAPSDSASNLDAEFTA